MRVRREMKMAAGYTSGWKETWRERVWVWVRDNGRREMAAEKRWLTEWENRRERICHIFVAYLVCIYHISYKNMYIYLRKDAIRTCISMRSHWKRNSNPNSFENRYEFLPF
jgi:hypothetical protein